MLRRLGILAFCMSTLFGCTDGLFSSNSDDNKKSGDDEGATPPQNVNGSFYMTCLFVNQATSTSSNPKAEVGCVVKDEKTDKKIMTTEVAKYIDWEYVPMAPEVQQGVAIQVTDYDDTNTTYHAMYTFTGGDATVVNQVANDTVVRVKVKPLDTAKPEVTAFETPISTATQSQVATTPESKGIFGDNGTIKDPGSTPGG